MQWNVRSASGAVWRCYLLRQVRPGRTVTVGAAAAPLPYDPHQRKIMWPPAGAFHGSCGAAPVEGADCRMGQSGWLQLTPLAVLLRAASPTNNVTLFNQEGPLRSANEDSAVIRF